MRFGAPVVRFTGCDVSGGLRMMAGPASPSAAVAVREARKKERKKKRVFTCQVSICELFGAISYFLGRVSFSYSDMFDKPSCRPQFGYGSE
jgi:hypothetical protein